jgi:hypothetical protein
MLGGGCCRRISFFAYTHRIILGMVTSILLVKETGLSLAKQSQPDYSTSIVCKDDALNHILRKLLESNHFCPYPEAQGET